MDSAIGALSIKCFIFVYLCVFIPNIQMGSVSDVLSFNQKKKYFFSFVGKIVLFWLLVFFINRIIFYFIIFSLLKPVSWNLIVESFWHALRLDFSTLGYLTIGPIFFLSVYIVWEQRWLLRLANVLTYVAIVVNNMSAIGEGGLYREWKAKLNMQALSHFVNPDEVFKSASWDLSVLFFGLVSLLSFLQIWSYIKFCKPTPSFFNSGLGWKELVVLPPTIVIWVILIRGGLQSIPVQSSDSYFCNNPIPNDAAVNPLWNIAFEMVYWMDHQNVNIFKSMEDDKASAIVKKLLEVEKDTTEYFLTTKRPNIVFLILESWTANTVASFGGDNYAPYMDSLSKEGIRFTNFYPAGYVSDQGIVAILSGHPCTSKIAIINSNSKSTKIPCINEDLKPYGYTSGFLFGGDLNYGNIRSYLFNKTWDVVLEEKDFPSNLDHGSLGIHDADMSQELLKQLGKAKSPFVYSWFTVSTHRPYDYKGSKKKLVEYENDYLNSVVYSDKVLRDFFAEAKKAGWYDSTLFILCADHSHDCHKAYNPAIPEYHKIPMFFLGNVIKPEYRGKSIEKIFSQIDIVPTLLHQMDLKESASRYVWGRNMMNPYSKSFSYFCSFDNGGMVHPNGWVSFQFKSPALAHFKPKNKAMRDSIMNIVNAYQQLVYKDYIEK